MAGRLHRRDLPGELLRVRGIRIVAGRIDELVDRLPNRQTDVDVLLDRETVDFARSFEAGDAGFDQVQGLAVDNGLFGVGHLAKRRRRGRLEDHHVVHRVVVVLDVAHVKNPSGRVVLAEELRNHRQIGRVVDDLVERARR